MINDALSPTISVVIPVRNEGGFIDQCLESLFSAEPVPGGMEVIVVDGMSEDETREILTRWRERRADLVVLDNPQRIVPTAMNIGIRAARGKLIIRLDAHARYPADYLIQCLRSSQKTGADNVGGGIETLVPDNGSQCSLVQAMTTHRFGVGNSGFRIGAREGKADTVVFGCYRREVFDRIGIYDERLVRNQDYELNSRLRKAGGVVWFDPEIRVQYFNQSSLQGLYRQAFMTGQWNPWMWYIAPYSFAWRHAIPLAFAATVLTALLITMITPALGLPLLLLLLVPYFVAALFASAQQSLRYGIWMFPLLPALFFAYHLAYGLGGLWAGLVLALKRAPVQLATEPWPGAGAYRAWPKAKIVTQ